jgi:hypothetical protein
MRSDLSAPVFWAGLAGVVAYSLWSLPTISHPLGSDWGHYFTAAEYIWNPVEGVAYPDFRKPWYGWLLGGLGQFFGYLGAGQLLGKSAVVGMVLTAALLGSALADRWAGLAAAGAVVVMPLAMDGALWVNHYPLLGALVGLAFGSSAAAVRWPGGGWVCLAGLSAGTAYAVDFRGSVAIPVVTVLVLVGSQGLGFRSVLGRLLLLTVTMAGPLAHDVWLQRTFDVPQLRVEQQLQVQRKGTLEQIRQGIVGGDEVRSLCDQERLQAFDLQASWTPCGDALRRSSARRLADMRLIPQPALWFMLVLCLAPMRWSRSGAPRSVIASSAVFGVPFVSVAVGMGWVTYFDRYILPFAVLIAAVAPVGLRRFLGWLPLRSWRGVTAFSVSMAFILWIWPGWTARSLDSPEAVRSSEYHAGVFAQWAQSEVGHGDAVIDCAGLAVDSLLLPRRIDYVRFPPGDAECVSLVERPRAREGRTFLITMHRDLPFNARPSDVPFNVERVRALGWTDISSSLPLEGFRLWESK